MNFTISDAVAVAQSVATLKRHRFQKKMAVIKAFVKSSGGWNKAFYDKQPKAAVPVFDLLLKDGTWCLNELRMLSGDVIILCKVLGIPQEFRTVNRDRASGVDALCMLCIVCLGHASISISDKHLVVQPIGLPGFPTHSRCTYVTGTRTNWNIWTDKDSLTIIWSPWHKHSTGRMASCGTSLVSSMRLFGHVADPLDFNKRFTMVM